MNKEKQSERNSPSARGALAVTDNRGTKSSPVAVRQYAMTEQSRALWLKEHPDEASRVRLRKQKSAEKNQLMRNLAHHIGKLSFLLVFLIVLIVLAAVLQLTSSLFVIRDISVTGTEKYTAEELSAAGGFRTGDRMRSLSVKDAGTKILSQYPEFSFCEVKTDIQGNVSIAVEEYRPVLYFAMAGKYYAVTEDLVVTEGAESPQSFEERKLMPAEFPGLAAALEGRKLEFLSGNGEYITEFLRAARQSGLLENTEKISFENRYSIISYGKDGGLTRFGSVEDIDRKLLIAGRVRAENAGSVTALRIDVSEPDAVLVEEEK